MVGKRGKGNVLVIGHGALPLPECPCLSRDERSFGLAICLFQGERQAALSAGCLLDCASAQLPFLDGVFHTVIVYLLSRDGSEPELDEACRILAMGGELLILGLNCNSWGHIRTYRHAPVPGMRVNQVRTWLQARGMVIDNIYGAGLLGQGKPSMEWRRLSGIGLPFADLVVLRARHRGFPSATRLRLKEFPAGVVPTAITGN